KKTDTQRLARPLEKEGSNPQSHTGFPQQPSPNGPMPPFSQMGHGPGPMGLMGPMGQAGPMGMDKAGPMGQSGPMGMGQGGPMGPGGPMAQQMAALAAMARMQGGQQMPGGLMPAMGQNGPLSARAQMEAREGQRGPQVPPGAMVVMTPGGPMLVPAGAMPNGTNGEPGPMPPVNPAAMAMMAQLAQMQRMREMQMAQNQGSESTTDNANEPMGQMPPVNPAAMAMMAQMAQMQRLREMQMAQSQGAESSTGASNEQMSPAVMDQMIQMQRLRQVQMSQNQGPESSTDNTNQPMGPMPPVNPAAIAMMAQMQRLRQLEAMRQIQEAGQSSPDMAMGSEGPFPEASGPMGLMPGTVFTNVGEKPRVSVEPGSMTLLETLRARDDEPFEMPGGSSAKVEINVPGSPPPMPTSGMQSPMSFPPQNAASGMSAQMPGMMMPPQMPSQMALLMPAQMSGMPSQMPGMMMPPRMPGMMPPQMPGMMPPQMPGMMPPQMPGMMPPQMPGMPPQMPGMMMPPQMPGMMVPPQMPATGMPSQMPEMMMPGKLDQTSPMDLQAASEVDQSVSPFVRMLRLRMQESQNGGDDSPVLDSAVPGPVQMPVNGIQDLMTLENSLHQVRAKLLLSFYNDLASYKMLSQQIQQRMMVKLAMLQMVEARMAMPMRGTVAMGIGSVPSPMSISAN
ncbi:hypothetical protein BaRGS_00032361, partial [Batillaria attramentaria]